MSGISDNWIWSWFLLWKSTVSSAVDRQNDGMRMTQLKASIISHRRQNTPMITERVAIAEAHALLSFVISHFHVDLSYSNASFVVVVVVVMVMVVVAVVVEWEMSTKHRVNL